MIPMYIKNISTTHVGQFIHSLCMSSSNLGSYLLYIIYLITQWLMVAVQDRIKLVQSNFRRQSNFYLRYTFFLHSCIAQDVILLIDIKVLLRYFFKKKSTFKSFSSITIFPFPFSFLNSIVLTSITFPSQFGMLRTYMTMLLCVYAFSRSMLCIYRQKNKIIILDNVGLFNMT